MSDTGWVFNHAEDQWELLGIHGEVTWQVTAEFVHRAGVAAVNAKGARLASRWPELLPGRPYVQCVLADGPLAGCYQYLDPREHAVPPPVLCIDLEQPLVYRLTAQDCGHGNVCPWPYEFDRDADWPPPVPLMDEAGSARVVTAW